MNLLLSDVIIPQKLFDRNKKPRIRLSSMGKDLNWCWNEIKNPLPIDERTERLFDLGQMIEQYMLNGMKNEIYNKDMVVHTGLYQDGKEITGEIDCMWKDEHGTEYVMDVKSMSQSSFEKLVATQDLKESHYQYYVQLQLYMHFLKVEDGVILGYNKNNSDVAFCFITYDEEFALAQVERVKLLIELLKSDTEPELEYPNKIIIKTTKVRNAESYKSEGWAQEQAHKFNRFNPYCTVSNNIIECEKGVIYEERYPEYDQK